MLPRIAITGAALLALCACEKPASQDRNMSAEEVAEELSEMKIEPGQWDATTEVVEVTAPNVPGDMLKSMVGKKSSVSNCITPEQAAKPSANFLAAQSNNKCTYQNWSMEAGRMAGSMTCEGGEMPGKVAMTLTGNYGSTAYDLDMAMKTLGLPGGVTMLVKARITGRRTGQCTAT